MGFKLGVGTSEALGLQAGESSTGAEMSADSGLLGPHGWSHPVEDSSACSALCGGPEWPSKLSGDGIPGSSGTDSVWLQMPGRALPGRAGESWAQVRG